MSSIETEAGRNPGDEARRHAAQRNFEDNDPASIERNIDETRADVRATLAALERKLSVDRLMELTLGRIRDRGGEFASNLSDAATQNPVPLVLTTIGLAWMMLATRRGSDYSSERATGARHNATAVRHGVMSAADRVNEQVRGAAEASRDAFDHAAESMRDTASHAARVTRAQVESARQGAEYAQERMQKMLDEQPLILGALGLAAGALIGALLPRTEAEDRLVGDFREKAVQSAARTSRTMYEAARENAATGSAPAAAEDSGPERPSKPH